MTERFHPDVEAVLRTAGWSPGRRLSPDDLAAMHRVVGTHTGRFGGRLPVIDPADAVLAEFGGLAVESELPGVDQWPRPFVIDPTLARYHVETLIDVGRNLGLAVYPVGMEGFDEAVLAVTDLGSVIAVDDVGEWFLGGTIDEALDVLISGRRPRRLAAGDGRHASPWAPPEWESQSESQPDSHLADRAPLTSLEHPAGAAFFLPRTPANLPYVWLPDVLVRIGIVPTPSQAHPGQFEVGQWGGVACQVHALDLSAHTVLVLGFERDAALAQTVDRPPDLPPSIPVLTTLDHAFRNACAGLAPDLEVAFTITHRADTHRADPANRSDPIRQTPDLLRLLAAQEVNVRARSVESLLSQEFDLLYLSERAARGAGAALAARNHEELPITRGALLRAIRPPQVAPA